MVAWMNSRKWRKLMQRETKRPCSSSNKDGEDREGASERGGEGGTEKEESSVIHHDNQALRCHGDNDNEPVPMTTRCLGAACAERRDWACRTFVSVIINPPVYWFERNELFAQVHILLKPLCLFTDAYLKVSYRKHFSNSRDVQNSLKILVSSNVHIKSSHNECDLCHLSCGVLCWYLMLMLEYFRTC